MDNLFVVVAAFREISNATNESVETALSGLSSKLLRTQLSITSKAFWRRWLSLLPHETCYLRTFYSVEEFDGGRKLRRTVSRKEERFP